MQIVWAKRAAVTAKVEKVLWAGAQAKCAWLKQKRWTNVDPMHCGDSEREEETIKRYGNAAGFGLVSWLQNS